MDGRALSTLVDAVILVGRSGITTRQAMRRSVELLSEIHGAPILQVVLNAAQPELHRLQALRVWVHVREHDASADRGGSRRITGPTEFPGPSFRLLP